MDIDVNFDSPELDQVARGQDVAHLLASGDSPIGAPGVASFRHFEWRQVIGALLIGIGLVAIVIGWWGVSGTSLDWKQIPYLVSGGIGGASLIGLGIAFFVSWEHSRDRDALRAVLLRLRVLESALDNLNRLPADVLQNEVVPRRRRPANNGGADPSRANVTRR
ncbi:MAG: hypothetical protein ACYCS2_06350 [Acidimicrobiales bacterium]